MNAIHIVLHVIYLVGAVCFIVFPFDRSRVRAPWARWIFWAVAALALALAVNGFGWDLQLWSYHLLSGIRGFALGLIFALIVSGQLSGKKILPNENAA
jgi:hypothetical protein